MYKRECLVVNSVQQGLCLRNMGQPVALKFLPEALASNPVQRERFFAQVRITRQLSHPNICRVYDISKVDGQHFLSMEYIDGKTSTH